MNLNILQLEKNYAANSKQHEESSLIPDYLKFAGSSSFEACDN
jgi:hypothetical protein